MSNWIFDTWLGIVSLSRYLFIECNYRVHKPTKSSLCEKKLEKSIGVARQCELKQQLSFYHLHSSSTKTPQNLRWKKKKATIFLCLPILTIPTFVFTLYPGGDGERRKRDKQRRWEGETDGVGKTASHRKGKNRLRWRAKVKRGGRLE